MLSSRKWNDGRHWRRFAALFSCSFLIICFLIHKAKGESSMLCSTNKSATHHRWLIFLCGARVVSPTDRRQCEALERTNL